MRPASLVLTLALFAWAEEPPEAPGVTVELSPERTEFALGDPILLDIVHRNDGKETWEVGDPEVLQFYDLFEVTDTDGKKVPNPYDDIEPRAYNGPVTMHKLLPGATVTIRKYLNECVAFEKPGEYVVTARAGNSGESIWTGSISGPPRKDNHNDYRCKSKPLKIKILPAAKKECEAAARDLKRLWCAPELRVQEEYARYQSHITEDNGKTDALHLLAFRRDQELLPFWLALAGNSDAAFVAEALAGLPDRAAVVKALEERIAKGEREQFLWLYVCLAVPKTDDVDWKNVYERRTELEKRYAEK
jgi:hypothetical protein